MLKSFYQRVVSQKYQELCLISETILIGFLYFREIHDRGFLFLRNTLLLYSLSRYRRTKSQTEKQIHSLCVGWRNLFSSCAVVSVFCSGGKQVLVLHTTYVLRVPYSCGVVLVFLVVAGNSFWCYVHTQSKIQLCSCVIFVVVTGKLILYEFSCSIQIFFFFWFWQDIVFGVTYVLSVQYSCVVVSVFLLWRES